MANQETRAPFSISQDSRVKLPLAMLWSLLVGAIVIGGYVYTLRAEVSQHTSEIAEVKVEARASRELLVRIDENVKQLKENSRR
jgi:hypothetical protein